MWTLLVTTRLSHPLFSQLNNSQTPKNLSTGLKSSSRPAMMTMKMKKKTATRQKQKEVAQVDRRRAYVRLLICPAHKPFSRFSSSHLTSAAADDLIVVV